MLFAWSRRRTRAGSDAQQDGTKLRTLTLGSPAVATGAHISVIGHVTDDEFRRYLDATEAANGFANRFILVCVRRSKILPEGAYLPDEKFTPLVQKVRAAISNARTIGTLMFDAPARALWREIYEDLSEGKPGLFGAVTSRAEAQVLRLRMLYALLEGSRFVRRPHLESALALGAMPKRRLAVCSAPRSATLWRMRYSRRFAGRATTV